MNKAVISRVDGDYIVYKTNSRSLFLFLKFLLRDVKCGKFARPERIKKWLDDPNSEEFDYGESTLEKNGNIITIETWLYVEDEFEISRDHFRSALDLWIQVCHLGCKEIVVTQNTSGRIDFSLNNNPVQDAIITPFKGKYRYPKSVNPALYNLAFFLIHEFEAKGLSHSFILNEWVEKTQCGDLYENPLYIEKKGGQILILRNPAYENRKNAFVTTKEKLRKIYKQFLMVKASRPNFIFITKIGDQIKVDGRDQET